MSLRIIHISDIHIRNLKYHDEYRRVFDNLYAKISELKPDIVINTGDTAHTKTQISPEFVEMASQHMRNVGSLVPYHIILGNHDMNLMNPDRQDAITPIIDSIKNDNIFLHKRSGLCHSIRKGDTTYNLWAFSLADTENYPTPASWRDSSDVNIGMFHGSVSTCVTDMNWRMTHVEHDLSIFDGLDFALLGDIHKQQFFKDRTIAYAGSLIQQNFGEEIDKGFLLWELGEKGEKHSVTSHVLRGNRSFYTVRLNDDLSISDMNVVEGSRVRISPPRQLTLVEQKDVEKEVKKQFKPYDIITLSYNNIGEQKVSVGKRFSDMENIRQIVVQEKLIREFFKDDSIDDDVMSKILDMNRRHQIHLDQEDTGARNINWKIKKIAWSNLFNYGENNAIDFACIPGLTGIFAANASGKSNLIDVLLETCFDATTKGVNKNIFLINDNKETATAVAEISANDQEYEIARIIEKIKYGQRSLDKVKEWGKTTVTFSMVDEAGGKEQLDGVSRSETEHSVRQRLGTFDDFLLTSLLAQWNPMDIISTKETKRKEIIYKFLDLDIFGQKALMAKDESRDLVKKLQDFEDDKLTDALRNYKLSLRMKEDELRESRDLISAEEDSIKAIDDSILSWTSQKVKIEKAEMLDRARDVKHIEDDIRENENKMRDLSGMLSSSEIDLAKIVKLESRFDLKLHEEKLSRTRQIEKDILRSESLINDSKVRLAAHVDNSRLLNEVPCGDKFPSCKFLVKAFESRAQISSLTDKISEYANDIKSWKKEIDDLKPFLQKLEDYNYFVGEKLSFQSKCDNLKLQIENVKLRLESLQNEKSSVIAHAERAQKLELDRKKNETIEKEIKALREKRLVSSTKLSELQDIVLDISRRIGSEQGIVQKLESELSHMKDVRNTCLAYEHYIRAMGKDGIAYQILTQKLPSINEEINKILSNVADFCIFLEHDIEEQSIRFHIQYGQYKSRLLELGSGAEKFIASIAIRNALLNISILPKTNMLIIDEGFGKLDLKNLENIQRMFDYLRTVFDHIIVISHLDTMKDMVDNIVEITTDEEGYAHVEVGG